jgi:hypothetical protein
MVSDETFPMTDSRTIRLFVSSAFSDMKAERNHLIAVMFPEGQITQALLAEFSIIRLR